MYHDIRGIYEWDKMKKDIAEFVVQCPNYHQVKIEHQKPCGLTTYSVEDYARLYIREIVRLHGIHISIISDRGAQFIVNYWRSFQNGLGTQEVEKIKLIREMLLTAQSRQKSYADNQRRDLEFQTSSEINPIASIKVLWIDNNVEEMTWEAEEEMKTRYPHLFSLPEKDQTETSQPLGMYMVLDSYVSYFYWSCKAIDVFDDCGPV
ncbi:uncharacterized protein [Nicotiana tomentosiformis]|uniref:uncharacterized protein n=1 Tax=Nicotiana tomentosiformis TaxID=4098 RepID=UPI00388C92A8